MVMKKYLYLFVPLVFGIPFLLLADLFPLHRYGMFSGLARPEIVFSQYSIHIHLAGKWQKLEAENEYLDKNYFPMEAMRAFGDKESENKLVSKIRASLRVKPDSIRLESDSASASTTYRIIFPQK